ncbi:MAG TPA: hypothetical protein VN328_01415 [Thermodesulfovibrionales bacterium]|nr:hypothetical protein [Thermodesulfovibrionales bacterium]
MGGVTWINVFRSPSIESRLFVIPACLSLPTGRQAVGRLVGNDSYR